MDKDVPIELFIENGKIKTPYKRGIAFAPCNLSKWYGPDVIPAIGSKIYNDGHNEKYYGEFRVYLLVVHGNDQYIVTYPEPYEITVDHPLYDSVVKHFASRGTDWLRDVPQFLFRRITPYGQEPIRDRPAATGSDAKQPGQFTGSSVSHLGFAAEFFFDGSIQEQKTQSIPSRKSVGKRIGTSPDT